MNTNKIKEVILRRVRQFANWNITSWKVGGIGRWKVIGLWLIILAIVAGKGTNNNRFDIQLAFDSDIPKSTAETIRKIQGIRKSDKSREEQDREASANNVLSLVRQRNYSKAKYFLEPLAYEGNSIAMMVMGGISKELRETPVAVQWLLQSCNYGHDQSCASFADIVLEGGKGLIPNVNAALTILNKLYQESEELGVRNIAAMSRANMYKTGRGVPQNEKLQDEWLRKAGLSSDDIQLVKKLQRLNSNGK